MEEGRRYRVPGILVIASDETSRRATESKPSCGGISSVFIIAFYGHQKKPGGIIVQRRGAFQWSFPALWYHRSYCTELEEEKG